MRPCARRRASPARRASSTSCPRATTRCWASAAPSSRRDSVSASSIARAVLKDTPILVLDEPTASLDAATELAVLMQPGEWGRGRAIFLITHRLSTIRSADQIGLSARDGMVEERLPRRADGPGGRRLPRLWCETEDAAPAAGNASGDERMSFLIEESEELTSRETLPVILRALRYVGPFKHQFGGQGGAADADHAASRSLILPWPIKILIDHVIGDIPDRRAGTPLPPLPRRPSDGRWSASRREPRSWPGRSWPSRSLHGIFAADRSSSAPRGASATPPNARLASGHDTATRTENEANEGWSFAGGLFGLFDFRFTMRSDPAPEPPLPRAALRAHPEPADDRLRRRAHRGRRLPRHVRHPVDHQRLLPDHPDADRGAAPDRRSRPGSSGLVFGDQPVLFWSGLVVPPDRPHRRTIPLGRLACDDAAVAAAGGRRRPRRRPPKRAWRTSSRSRASVARIASASASTATAGPPSAATGLMVF